VSIFFRPSAMPMPPCKYYTTAAGCRKGNQCNFSHGPDAVDYRPDLNSRPQKRPRVGPLEAPPPTDGPSPSQPTGPPPATHPCIRLYGSCNFKGCKFVNEPYDACMLCIKGKDHAVCDVGLEDRAMRNQIEQQFLAGGAQGKTCWDWIKGTCRFPDCKFSHFVISPAFAARRAPAPQYDRPLPPPTYFGDSRAPPPHPVPARPARPVHVEPALYGHPADALHPCVRVWGSCKFGETCKWVRAPRDACVKCLENKPHAACDTIPRGGGGGVRGNRWVDDQQVQHRRLEREAYELDLKEQELLRQERELDLLQRQIEVNRREKELRRAVVELRRGEAAYTGPTYRHPELDPRPRVPARSAYGAGRRY